MADTPERRPSGVAPPAERATGPAITPAGADRSGAGTSGASGSGHSADSTADEARRQASRLADEAKQRGKSMLDEQKGNAANQLSGIASALRQTASQCSEHPEQRTAGRALEQAASGLDRFASALRDRDVDSLLHQASGLMRRQPALFIGGTIAAGFLLSRFAKSSAEREHSHSHGRSYGDTGYGRGGRSADPMGRSPDAGASAGEGRSYVTSAHVNPGEVAPVHPSTPPVTPTGRRDY